MKKHLLSLKRIIIVLVIICLNNVILFSQTNVYVVNSTELANACTNASSGSVINIAAGTYKGPFVISGKNNVTLTSYNGTVFLEGNSNAATNGIVILQISNSNSIKVQNLVFRNNWGNFGDGININGAGDGINISNCEFYNIGWTTDKTLLPNSGQNAHAIVGVGSSSTSLKNIFIGGNNIHDCITGYSESLTLAGNVEIFLIEGNTLNSNTNIGIDATGYYSWTGAPSNVNYSRSGIIRKNVVSNYAGPAQLDAAGGIYIDGGSYITVENNIVYNYKIGLSVGCEVAGNSSYGNIIRNNLIYNCSLSGLFVGSNTTSMVNNTEVYNNTFYKCGTGVYDNGQIALLNNSGTVIKNNICYPADGKFAMVQMSGTTTSNKTQAYNLFWRDNATINNLFYNITGDANAITQNPLFTNAGSNNFHISTTSPAVNAGDPAFNGSGQTDMDGNSRVQGGRVDIGAYETGGTISVTGITVSPTTSSLAVAAKLQLIASVLPTNATNKSVTWTSSNTAIATVNSSGLVTAVATGSATITVRTTDGGYTATCAVTVTGTSTGTDITNLGGTISTQYTGSPANEGIAMLIDNSSSTKFLTFNASAWVQYQAPSGYIVTSYTMTSANDAAERDPLNWTLQGSNNGTAWTTINTQNAQDFATRFLKRSFSFTNTTSYAYYRLNMTNNSGTILQLAELELFGVPGTTTVPVTGVSLSPTSSSIAIAGTQQLTATVTPTNATNKAVTWATSNSAVATVSASGLVTGVAAGSATITVTTIVGSYKATCAVTVTPSSSFTTTIQAESYSSMAGVATETTTDAGGGLNVGWIEAGDWMAYPAITIPAAGTYTIEYRVASMSGGGSLQFELVGGAPIYGTLAVPSTGGWQTWTTIKHTVTLSAGSQSFAIKALAGGWNINWFAITQGIKTAEKDGANSILSELLIYPNPVNDVLTIMGKDDGALVEIYSVTGVKVIVTILNEVDVSYLTPGLYLIKTLSSGIITQQIFIVY